MSSYVNGLEISSNYYYHYTTAENAVKIWKCGELMPSTDVVKDCSFGVGIYFTTLNPYPDNTKEVILENNYGTENKLNKRNADCFIRIPRSSFLPKTIFRVSNTNRNIYMLPMPQHSYLRLKNVQAEISCFQCKYIPAQMKTETKCTNCNGVGVFSKGCDNCNNKGLYQPYRQCWDCQGSGIVSIKEELICQHCEEGKIEVECDECCGWDYYICMECEGEGIIKIDCQECDGEYKKENWVETECGRCNGTGNYAWDYGYQQCKNCGGNGTINFKCNQCQGHGDSVSKCGACQGKGVFYFG